MISMDDGLVLQGTYCIRNLLNWLNIVAGNQFIVGVEKFDTRFLEGSLS
jgi:hypothetical protein